MCVYFESPWDELMSINHSSVKSNFTQLLQNNYTQIKTIFYTQSNESFLSYLLFFFLFFKLKLITWPTNKEKEWLMDCVRVIEMVIN